jgi:cytochrome c oxidase subunit 2
VDSNAAVRTGPPYRRSAVALTLFALAGLALAGLAGCGGSGSQSRPHTGTYNEATAASPFSHEQVLVEEGGRLFVTEGCSGCHTLGQGSRYGPSLEHLAGTHVTLQDGRSVLVEEHYLRAALLDPAQNAIRGYPATAMIAAVRRLDLKNHREAVAALAAFIEQIGPEGD